MTSQRLLLRTVGMLAGTFIIVAFFGELRRSSGFAQMITMITAWFIALDLGVYLRDRAKRRPGSEA